MPLPYISTYYGLYFAGTGGVVRLPINPEKLPITWDNDNKEANVLDIGPIMIPRTPALRKVSVSSFFPGMGASTPPETYINFFTRAMANMEVIAFVPVRFYEDGTPFATSDTGFECLVTEFVYEERAGETGDFYYDLTCTEYRDYTPQRMQIAGGTATGPGLSPAASTGVRTARLARAAATPQLPAASTQGALRLMASPSRNIPQGQLYAGAFAVANGPAWQTSEKGGASQQLNGRRVAVMRIDNSAPSGVYVTSEDGEPIGWVSADSLQMVSET